LIKGTETSRVQCMILKYNKITKTEKSLLCNLMVIDIEHSRYFAVFVILLWFNIIHYTPACYSTFYQITIDLYSILKFLIFLYTCIKTHGSVSCSSRSWHATPWVCWQEERKFHFHTYVASRSLTQIQPNLLQR